MARAPAPSLSGSATPGTARRAPPPPPPPPPPPRASCGAARSASESAMASQLGYGEKSPPPAAADGGATFASSVCHDCSARESSAPAPRPRSSLFATSPPQPGNVSGGSDALDGAGGAPLPLGASLPACCSGGRAEELFVTIWCARCCHDCRTDTNG